MDEDEDSRLFLSMLDAAAERIFENMAAELSAITVACDTETVHQITSYRLQQDDESCSQLNTLPYASQESSYRNQSCEIRKCEMENTGKFDHFSKQFQEVIDKLESLIPSLQKVANGVETPINQRKAGKLEMRYNSNSNSEDDQVNRLGMTNVLEVARNDVANAGKYAEHSECILCGEVDQMFRDGIVPISSSAREKSGGKDKRLRFQTPVPSVESSSFRRPKKIRSIDKSDRKAGKSHAKEKRMSRVRDTIHRPISRRKSTNGASKSKITLHNQMSEETRWRTGVQQSGSPSSFTGSYLSTDLYTGESDETAGGYEKVRQSSRKWSDTSQSYTDSDTFSDYNSQDRYSYISQSSQGSSEWSPRWEDHRIEKGKKVGRIKKLRNKLGTVFHLHQHHHYNDRDESDLGGVGLLKRLGKFFHRSGKNDRKRVKPDKPPKSGNKSVVKKKQDVGHFRTLVDGLRSKKPKKVKDDKERLGSGRHKSKRTKKKLPWLPKMGRGKVKVANKGKAKLNRIATKTAKMILT